MSDQPAVPPDVVLLPPQACPVCRYNMNAIGTSDGTDATMPRPGDCSVCMFCAVVLVFTDTLTLRVLTNAEWIKLPLDARVELTQMRQKLLEMHAAVGLPQGPHVPPSTP